MPITWPLELNAMSYFYSAKTNSFYPLSLKADYENGIGWPDDAVEVSMAVFTEYSETPPDGKVRIAGADGYPTWGDIPPPTPEQQRAIALQVRTALIAEASRNIAPWLMHRPGVH
ncbi:tail fiber assembly protein [Buttiauxella agrestis]